MSETHTNKTESKMDMENTIINVCQCGDRRSLANWRELPSLGILEINDENEHRMPCAYEYRRCPCGTAREIGLDGYDNYYPEVDVEVGNA